MTETDFALDAPEGAKIYGLLNTVGSDRVIVFSHGFTGNPTEHHYQAARRYFNDKGYDVVRFAYYDAMPRARRLKDCTLEIHAADLNAVVAHFAPRYKKLFVVGHSYGGMTMLFGLPPAVAYSFWDATFVPVWWKMAHPVAGTDFYAVDWGMDQLVGKAMHDEARAMTAEDTAARAGKVTIPSQVVIAGADNNKKTRVQLFDALTSVPQKEYVEIDGANHTFTKEDKVFDLLTATEKWFGRF